MHVSFFKQKTAYKLRISDWSSDLCSSDRDIEGRTQYWYYPKAHKGLDIPGMGAPEALVFRMAELYLGRALPAAQVRRLEPYFSQARGVIEREGIPLARWRKRVRVIERGQIGRASCRERVCQ